MTQLVKFVRSKLSDSLVVGPEYKTVGASGADIRANFPVELRDVGVKLLTGRPVLVPTGLSVHVPHGFEIQVRPRSGLALNHAISIINSPGTIDSDYRGEVGVIMINLSQTPFHVCHGDRIAQLVVAPVARAIFELVDTLDNTERASGGFGSTGIK
jgi:dUTP pyrophosphatase